jgi:hypothetical protein
MLENESAPRFPVNQRNLANVFNPMFIEPILTRPLEAPVKNEIRKRKGYYAI